MTTLTYKKIETADVECPPEDVYVLELVEIGDFHDKPAFKANPADPDIINTQSRFDFQIVDFDYDEDEDDRDWNGARVSDYYVFFKQYPDGKKTDTWLNERSNAFAILTALMGHTPEDGEDINLESLIGKRIKATVTPKASGWPKITKPLPFKKRRKKAEPDPVADDDDAFDDE